MLKLGVLFHIQLIKNKLVHIVVIKYAGLALVTTILQVHSHDFSSNCDSINPLTINCNTVTITNVSSDTFPLLGRLYTTFPTSRYCVNF